MQKKHHKDLAWQWVRRWGTWFLALTPPLAGLPGLVTSGGDPAVVGMWLLSMLVSPAIAWLFYRQFTRLAVG